MLQGRSTSSTSDAVPISRELAALAAVPGYVYASTQYLAGKPAELRRKCQHLWFKEGAVATVGRTGACFAEAPVHSSE
eukprot:7389935-Prymnesium_polylepis.1